MHYVVSLHGSNRRLVVEAKDEADMAGLMEDPYATVTTDAGTIIRTCWITTAERQTQPKKRAGS